MREEVRERWLQTLSSLWRSIRQGPARRWEGGLGRERLHPKMSSKRTQAAAHREGRVHVCKSQLWAWKAAVMGRWGTRKVPLTHT